MLEVARSINDSGEIVGYGTFDGVREAFMLTVSVPEPSSLILLVIGGAGLLTVRRLWLGKTGKRA